MTTITVTCQECKQTFQTEVDEEGLKFIGLERLQRMARCDRCVDRVRSQQRREYFARTHVAKSANEPF